MTRYEKFITGLSVLHYAIDNNITLIDSCRKHCVNDDFVYDMYRRGIRKLLSDGIITNEESEEFLKLYELKKNNRTAGKKALINSEYEHESFNINDSIDYDKSYGVIIRDQSEKITCYKYNVTTKFGDSINGILSRDEMNNIYSKYSKDGQNMSIQSIANEMHLSRDILMKILKVFGITKFSVPFAPHIIEEKDIDSLINDGFESKKIKFYNTIEQRSNLFWENEYKKLLNKYNNIKTYNSLTDKWINSIDLSNTYKIYFDKEKINDIDKRALIIYLSDWHIGAAVDKDSIFQNYYNLDEVNNRLDKVLKRILDLHNNYGRFERIIIVNVGDSLDGYNSTTTRGGHTLEQNMNNKEQFNGFILVVKRFMDQLISINAANNISYYSVGDSNHDGDIGYMANKCIETYLNYKYPDIDVRIFDKFIEHFFVGDSVFVICHGKDKKYMKSNMPLYLDNKTENYIHQYLIENKLLYSKVNFIKGDLHQTSTCYGHNIRYKNVSSLFGSSEWIHINFGNTKAAVDYDIVEISTNNILEGHIELN